MDATQDSAGSAAHPASPPSPAGSLTTAGDEASALPDPRSQAIASLTAAGQPYALADEELRGQRIRVFVHAPQSLRALF